jgi:hypothetical protein
MLGEMCIGITRGVVDSKSVAEEKGANPNQLMGAGSVEYYIYFRELGRLE